MSYENVLDVTKAIIIGPLRQKIASAMPVTSMNSFKYIHVQDVNNRKCSMSSISRKIKLVTEYASRASPWISLAPYARKRKRTANSVTAKNASYDAEAARHA